eukprot:gene40799-53999_t
MLLKPLEELVAPLSLSQSQDQAKVNLQILLQQLEIRPMTMEERITLDLTVVDFMKAHDIREDSNLARLFTKRLSFAFLPTVTTLIPKTSRTITDNQNADKGNNALSPINSVHQTSKPNISKQSVDNPNATVMPLQIVTEQHNNTLLQRCLQVISSGTMATCTIKRTRSALRTNHTYILQLE